MADMPVVIVGDGIAGMSAARRIRSCRPNDRIVIISNDPQPFYYRAALTNFLEGHLSREELWAQPHETWQGLGLERSSHSVSSLNLAQKCLFTTEGGAIPYHRLLLACGASAMVPQMPDQASQNADKEGGLGGVLSLRTLRDANAILERLPAARRVLVVGGGILGCEVAAGLSARNLKVTLVHRGTNLLEKVVDKRASEIIGQRMLNDGVDLRLSTGVREYLSHGGNIRAVALTDGARLECDMVVNCIGVRPNTDWLRDSGIKLDRGYVEVNRFMEVAGASDVWAAGDVVTVNDPERPFDNPGGLWQPARRQGEIAGRNMSEPYGSRRRDGWRPGYALNSTVAWGVNIVTCGVHADFPAEHVLSEQYPSYKRAVIQNDRLIGFMLINDRREATALHRLINLKGDAGNVRTIRSRIFDADFDLAGWVAGRSLAASDNRWNKTEVFYTGSRNREELITQKDLSTKAVPKKIEVNEELETVLTLQYGVTHKVLRSGTFCVGDLPTSDVRMSLGRTDAVNISSVGGGWILSSIGSSVLLRNGEPVLRPVFLADLDSLQFGDWKAVVRLRRLGADTRSTVRHAANQYFELIGQRRHQLRAPLTRIGSSADSDIRIQASGLSPEHAHIVLERGDWYLVDVGSIEGTSVNGQRVSAPHQLRADDLIEIGSARLQVTIGTALAPEHVQSLRSGDQFYLACEEGPLAPRCLEFYAPCILGRDEISTITVDDPLASRLHAEVTFADGRFLIADKGSMNGTWIEGERLRPGESRPLTHGVRFRIGSSLMRFERTLPTNLPLRLIDNQRPRALKGGTQLWRQESVRHSRFSLTPLLQTGEAPMETIVVEGAGPHVLGRERGAILSDLNLRLSRNHAEISTDGTSFVLRDLGSARGTALNGKAIGSETVKLHDEDEIRLDFLPLRFKLLDQENCISVSENLDLFRGEGVGDPLETDIATEVRRDLDACIGCHLCMRACPLPDAKNVTIGALNAYADNIGSPNQVVRKFVDDCTQCLACVPVCPANVKRSRIVLWNKLKDNALEGEEALTAQLGSATVKLDITRRHLVERLSVHPVFRSMSEKQLRGLIAQSRFRVLMPGEILLKEGYYPDAFWLLLDGALSVEATVVGNAKQKLIELAPGQTAGESALLSDQPSDVSVLAYARSIVMGFGKYSLKYYAALNSTFNRALRALNLERTGLATLRRAYPLINDEELSNIFATARVERISAGEAVALKFPDSRMQAVVLRGFLKEVRGEITQEVCRNYLRAGDPLHINAVAHNGEKLRYVAASVVELMIFRQPLLAGSASAPIASRISDSIAAEATLVTSEIVQGERILAIKIDRCVDCDNCVDACGRRHGNSRIDRSGSGKQVGGFHIPGSCYHCEDPKCLLCYVDGIVREATGEIRIVADRCIGCGACADRCPYDNIKMVDRDANVAPVAGALSGLLKLIGKARREVSDIADNSPDWRSTRVAVKCDLCAGFSDGPACVNACPTGAAQRRSPAEILNA